MKRYMSRTEGRPEAGRAEAERAEDSKEEAGWGGRCEGQEDTGEAGEEE